MHFLTVEASRLLASFVKRILTHFAICWRNAPEQLLVILVVQEGQVLRLKHTIQCICTVMLHEFIARLYLVCAWLSYSTLVQILRGIKDTKLYSYQKVRVLT